MNASGVGRAGIDAAAQRIAGRVRETPVIAFDATGAVVLKLECLQHAGSFKPRGAFNRILSSPVPAAGVIAASGGNHGLAVAYAARELGITAEIFVPETTPAIKLARLDALGAAVHRVGREYAEAALACGERQRETGALMVHAYDQDAVVAGQGTAGREFDRQVRGLDTVLVAVGGGGFIGGVAAWFEGRARVIAVEPETSCALHAALAAGQPVDVDVSGIAADSLGARRVGSVMFPIARRCVERVVLVDDGAIRDAQRLLWNQFRVVAEPGGAAALSALLSGRYRPEPGERVGVFVCGANCDPATVASS
ncbi:MAG: threonine/serine dehydratase [Burkholderiales bacterium]